MLNNKTKDLQLKDHYAVALPIGTVLHNGACEYTIEEFLGAGGFSITYRASAKIMVNNVPVETPVNFAIKELLMKGGERENGSTTVRYPITLRQQAKEAMADFVVEANRINKLNGRSEHIVSVKEVFLENNTAYYVMQYLKGGDVADYVLKRGRLLEDQAIAIIRPVAEAVEVIHQEKLLHLDIKPANIFFKEPPTGQSQCPVLADFGIAMHFDSKGTPASTNFPRGFTPGYAPIEQYGTIDHFSPQIDVYALGATLYTLLVGEDPKDAYAITEEDILGKLPENISGRTRQAILNAMKKDPMQRTPDARAFLDSLEEEYVLPVGTVLKSPQIEYRITALKEELHDYLVYEAVINKSGEDVEDDNKTDAAPSSFSSVTQTKKRKQDIKASEPVFLVYEYFIRRYCKRNDDGTVINSLDPRNTMARAPHPEFLEKVSKRIGQINENGIPMAEKFEGNGTSYIVGMVVQEHGLFKQMVASFKSIVSIFSKKSKRH